MTKSLSAIVRYLLYGLLIFTPLAHGSVHGWAITCIHLITLIALTAFLLHKTWTWNWKWISTPLDKPFFSLIVLCIASTVFSAHRHISLWSLVLLINYVVIFYLVINAIQTRSQLRHLIYAIIGVATFLTLYGLLKRFSVNPFPWWDYSYYEHNLYRVTATFVNPNNFAGYLEMTIPLLVGLFLTGLQGGRLLFVTCLVILMITAHTFCLSRGGWISAAFGLAFMLLGLLRDRHFEKKKMVAAFAGAMFLLVFVILTSTTVAERLRTLEEGGQIPHLRARLGVGRGIVTMIQDYPFLGTGPGTFAVIFTQYQPPGQTLRYFMAHNDYLHITSEIGLAFVAILIWMIIVFYKKGVRKLKHPSRLVRGTTLGAMSGITAILVHSIFDFNLHIPANAILFTVLAAIAISPIPLENALRLPR